MPHDPRDSLLKTSPEELALRRSSGALSVLGTTIIILGIWSLAKTVLSLIYMPDKVRDEINQSVPPEAMPVVVGIIAGAALLTFALRIYIGLSARAEAAGQKKRPAYLFLTGVLFAEYLYFIYFDILYVTELDDQIFANLGDLFIGMTSMGVVAFLLVNAIRVRRLKRQLGEA